jgi:hypothetical protein
MVKSVNFLVVRCALIDLCGADASTSGSTTSCTSYMGSVGAETFLGVSQISLSCTLLPLTPLERLFLQGHHCERQTLYPMLYYKNNIL